MKIDENVEKNTLKIKKWVKRGKERKRLNNKKKDIGEEYMEILLEKSY